MGSAVGSRSSMAWNLSMRPRFHCVASALESEKAGVASPMFPVRRKPVFIFQSAFQGVAVWK